MNTKPVTINHVGPQHPPRVSSAASMGIRSRAEGAESTVRVTIDLGLKTGQLGEIVLSVSEATKLADDILHAAVQALTVNERER